LSPAWPRHGACSQYYGVIAFRETINGDVLTFEEGALRGSFSMAGPRQASNGCFAAVMLDDGPTHEAEIHWYEAAGKVDEVVRACFSA
jgi:hypothetical protein